MKRTLIFSAGLALALPSVAGVARTPRRAPCSITRRTLFRSTPS